MGKRVVVAKDIPRDALFGDGRAEIAIPAGEKGCIVEEAVYFPTSVVQFECRGGMCLFVPDEYLTIVE